MSAGKLDNGTEHEVSGDTVLEMLGHTLALKTGASYESLVVNRIARPLAMDSTRITLTTEMKARLARGHWADGSPSENIKFQVGTRVALDADAKTGLLRITSVYPKSPAGQAGLSAGLMIRKIDGVAVEGKSLPECLGLIRGPAGTRVQFELINLERKETNTVELTRQKFVTSTG